ncbi:MAG TPA: hypothetical protein VFH22_07335 [Rhodocyclaceae bacterium]|nr:hypothetical protein [Rhodocyclaceae bacterium]
MAVRIKRHWFQDGRERSPEEQATVIAVAVWKSATHGLQGLRKAKFSVDVGDPFIRVLAEFVVFLVTVADRVAYLHVPPADAGEVTEIADQPDWRQAFTVALARRLATIYQENLDQLIGPLTVSAASPARNHADVFIELLNRRMAEYAEFDYDENGPEFAFLRYFGNCVAAALPDSADQRWVLDQIMASQAPEAIEIVDRGMRGVLGLDPKPQRQREGAAAD